jgi:uncharacterized protein YjbI with pentapeptide repeats
VERKKPGRKSKSGLKKESGRWRPATRQVLWAIGMVLTLMTISLLVVQLYPGLWEDVSREPVALLKGRVATLIGIGVALTALIVLLAKGSASLGWTGFRGKTLWDLLQLLIVPLVLVGIGFLFEMQQADRQQAIEEQQQALENRRAKAERELAEQRAQDEALQAYLDQMSSLLLEKDLRASEEDSEVRTLARARTLTVLRRLDPGRKATVIQFLAEAELVQRVKGSGPIISLVDADVSDANLSDADLSDADLSETDLSDADLSNAYLRDADLSDANLSDANLVGAVLGGAYLLGADLGDANLSGADLSNANLFFAHLSNANLFFADLSNANLGFAHLCNAYLGDADGVTKERLEQEAKSLEGTIMPDGTIYSGRYAARKFEPALSFSASDGWRLSHPETTDELSIEGPEGGQLTFTSSRHVYDPSNPSEPKEVPAPKNIDEWVSWFQSHPNLDTSEPVSMSVGGASGEQIDVTVTSTPENYPRDLCGEQPCIPLYPSGETSVASLDGWKDRFVIVDVGGETVIIAVGTQADRFDELLPKAQKVLDTVEWKGG